MIFLRWKKILNDESGATMAEYAIMVGFIAAVCAGMVALLGDAVLKLFDIPSPPF
jgi:Flp pilus assembly pilin Flp